MKTEKTSNIISSELIIGFVLYSLLSGYLIWFNDGPFVSNDYYQYESVAQNFLKGEISKTSIIHFDAERSHGTADAGVMPAPLTTFPAGFSLLVAGLAMLGLPVLSSAALLSWTAGAGLLVLLAAFSKWVGLSRPFRYALLGLFACNTIMLLAATAVLTEALFTFVTFGAILLLIRGNHDLFDRRGLLDRHDMSAAYQTLILAYALIGLSYWLRYAGIFVLLGGLAVQGLLFLYLRNARSFKAGLCGLVGIAFVALGFLRNWWLVGTWKGGNDKPVEGEVVTVLTDFVRNGLQILFGPDIDVKTQLLPIACLLAIALLVLLFLYSFHRADKKILISLFVFATYILVYTTLLLYAAFSSVISFGPRMFVPLIPVLACSFILMAFMVWTSSKQGAFRKVAASAFLAGFLSYALVNVTGLWGFHYATPSHHTLASSLDGEDQAILSLIDETIEDDAVFIANQGQALAHLIQRPVVSLISANFSQAQWDEEAVRTQARRYGANYLLLVSEPSANLLEESAFLKHQSEGKDVDWLTEIAHNRASRLFRIRHDETDDQQAISLSADQ